MKKIYFLAISIISYVFVGAVNHSVTTVGNTFSPANININLGDTVTWTNGGGSHNINATLATYPNNPEGFGNSISSSSWSFQHIFSIAGNYDYQCDPHTSMGMVGTVVVQSNTPNALTFTAIMDMSLGGTSGRAVMLTANQAIANLSDYTLINYNNGNTTPFRSDVLPSVSISSGQHVVLCRDSTALSNYFDGCLEQFSGSLYPTIILENSAYPTGNGNDAYELAETSSGNSLEVYGIIGDNPDTQGAGCNSPTCWDTEDSWAWKDTAFSNVGNWVYGSVNCTDNSTTTQTSSCPFPLATTVCLTTTSDITFKVDMSQNLDTFNIPEINATFNNWCGNCNPLSDNDGDEIWETTVSLNPGDTIEYKFSSDNWAFQETLDPNETCTNGLSNFTNRFLIVPSNNTVLDDVCWGSCSPCATDLETINSYQVNIYPNPSSKEIFISSISNIKYVEIFNSMGQNVYQNNLESSKFNLNIADFDTGYNIVKVVFEDKVSIVNFIKH